MRNSKLGRLYRDGEIVIHKGDEGTCLFVIQEGKVEVYDENGGNEVKIAELGASEFFGEMGLFEKDVRSCTVRALGNAKILTIDKKNFYKTIQKDPTLAYRLLQKMSSRLRELNKKVAQSEPS
jgi:CRP/FNR family cyclic AMP-dependent transcriptional regulator